MWRNMTPFRSLSQFAGFPTSFVNLVERCLRCVMCTWTRMYPLKHRSNTGSLRCISLHSTTPCSGVNLLHDISLLHSPLASVLCQFRSRNAPCCTRPRFRAHDNLSGVLLNTHHGFEFPEWGQPSCTHQRKNPQSGRGFRAATTLHARKDAP